MIYIGSDHAGFEVKETVKDYLSSIGMLHRDMGPYEYNKDDDYPLFAFDVAEAAANEPFSLGILICSSGVGMAIAANKVKGARAACIQSVEGARLAKEHNNCNVLVIDKLTFDPKLDFEIIKTFIFTAFSQEERDIRRLKQISDYENPPSDTCN